MLCGLEKEKCTRFRKKKKEKKETRKRKEKEGKKGKKRKRKKKKEKNLIAAKSGLVGIKGYLKTYNHAKYSLLYSSRF